MSDQSLHQLVYRSTYSAARVDNGLTSLRDIVQASKRNNMAQAITGYLVFDGETFMQVLEGERHVIEAAYARIAKDARHHSPVLIGLRMVAARQFEAWAMAAYLRGPREADIFRRYGVAGPIADAQLDADAVVSLMRDLAAAQARPPA